MRMQSKDFWAGVDKDFADFDDQVTNSLTMALFELANISRLPSSEKDVDYGCNY